MNTLKAAIGLVIALCFLVAFAWFLFRVATIPSVHTLSYDSFLTIMLTALGVMVATFAILVGLAAIWGYAGLKDYLRELAVKKVDEAVQETLKKYPASADILAAVQRLREHADFWDDLRNQVVTTAEPKSVAKASNADVQVVRPETPLESINQQVTPIEKYPGTGEKEDDDVSGDGKSD